jgi:hypothetical protein
VNPEPQVLTVPSGSRVEVVTFMGSPARTFTADVRCSPEVAARGRCLAVRIRSAR